MYVLAALACFHARAKDGDLEVRTVFESLGVKRFPATLPAFTVVSRVAWGPGEVAGGVLGFDLLDGRGRPLMEPIRVSQRVEPTGPDRLAVQCALFNVPQLVAEEPGLWQGIVSVDEREVSRVPVLIHERVPGDVAQKIPTD
jgi:hypothetical protein